jgi:hypothetical protein
MTAFALADLIAGVLLAGDLVAALFFARFYRDSGDRLFLWFAAGFGLLAVQRATIAAADLLPTDPIIAYVIRLAAFLLFLAAIVDKNRPRGEG